MQKDFIAIHDLTRYEFQQILDMTDDMKKRPRHYRQGPQGTRSWP